MYIQVNMGRNIGNTPMEDNPWESFIAAVQDALIDHRASLDLANLDDLEMHEGLGTWADGTEEESVHISGLFRDDYDLDGLRVTLRDIQIVYGQEAVALITGSELI